MFDVIASQVPKIPFRIMVVQILLTMAIIIAGLYCYVDGKRRDLKYPWGSDDNSDPWRVRGCGIGSPYLPHVSFRQASKEGGRGIRDMIKIGGAP
jgi:hypothetical protein